MAIQTKSKSFISESFKTFLKQVILVSVSASVFFLLSFSWLHFLEFGNFYFSKLTFFFLLFFSLFLLSLEGLLFEKTSSLFFISLLNFFSFSWIFLFLENFSFYQKNKIFLLLMLLSFLLLFLGEILIRQTKKEFLSFSFSKISSFSLFLFVLFLILIFDLSFHLALFSGKFFWLDELFKLFNFKFKSSQSLEELLFEIYHKPEIVLGAEILLQKNLPFEIDFSKPISELILKILKQRKPLKVFLAIEFLIFFFFYVLFSLISFLVKIFGGFLVEVLLALGFLKKSYLNRPQEIIKI